MKKFAWISLICTVFTWPLISFGAFVRLKGAGLACPDWPLCYGKIIPPAGFGIAIEVGHRFVATFVGFLITILLIASFIKKELFPYRKLIVTSFVLISIQGVLGGLTVLMKLEPYIVTGHLLGGNLVFACLICLTYLLFKIKKKRVFGDFNQKNKTVLIMSAIFFVMLISGGYNSTTYSGYACYAFPNCLPEEGLFNIEGSSQWIHMIHRLTVILGSLALGFLAIREFLLAPRNQMSYKLPAATIIGLLVSEMLVGIINSLYHVPVPVSTLHTALASTITGVLAYMYISTRFDR